LAAHPEAALAAPRLANTDGSMQHSVYRFPSIAVAAAVCFVPQPLQRGPVGRRMWLEGYAPHDRSGPVDWAIGAVHCIRRAALHEEPPYRERWFMYVEDMDLCWRLRRAGWQVLFDADVVVPHVGNASGRQAWGDDRTARWLDPTYDWYALERGDLAARTWSAVNVLGLLTKLWFAAVAVLLQLPPRNVRRARVAELLQWLRLHGHKLLHGPRAPLVGTGLPGSTEADMVPPRE
jgi:GT2 family glycosyltransferase